MASLVPSLSVNLHSLSITTVIIIIILSVLSLPTAVNSAISGQELESMLASLRSHNYNLFSNAITTSDILYDIHVFNTTTTTARSFTIFAPSDASLFALDMTSTALLYTQTLRYHIVPHRFSVSDLRRFPAAGISLHTLLPRQDIHISRRRSPRSDIFSVDGVDVVVPGLFYGRNVAVHGLAGILNFRSPVLRVSPVNRTVLPPFPDVSPVNNSTVFGRPLHPRLPLVNVTIPLPVPPANRSSSPVLPQPPTADGGVSLAHSPEFAPDSRHLVHSPAPSIPEIDQSPAHSPDVAVGPGHLLPPPTPLSPETASPPTNGSVAEFNGSAGPVRSKKKLLEISVISVAEMAIEAAVFEEAGEFPTTEPPLTDEKEAETHAMMPEGSWPSDENQTADNQVTGGELLLDHVGIQAGHRGVLQEL